MSIHPFGNRLKFPPGRSHCPKPSRKNISCCRIIYCILLKLDFDWHSQVADTSQVVYFEVKISLVRYYLPTEFVGGLRVIQILTSINFFKD